MCFEWFQCSSHPSPAQICSPGRKQLQQEKTRVHQKNQIALAPSAALSQIWHLRARWKQPTQGRVHQDGVVELGWGLGDVDCLHLLEAAQRVTLGHQLRDGTLVEGSGDQQDDVIDHVAVPASHEGATAGGQRVFCVYDSTSKPQFQLSDNN